jgi:hypothetical protein
MNSGFEPESVYFTDCPYLIEKGVGKKGFFFGFFQTVAGVPTNPRFAAKTYIF